ncbi:MAG: phosphatidate cytidylyltransferase [Acidimicrobiales bacterium]
MVGGLSTRQPAARRPPAHRKVDEPDAEVVSKRASAPHAEHAPRRYAMPYEINGPRVRLGILWFGVAAVAIVLGPLPTAVVYGGAAALAAMQVARVWRRRRMRPNQIVAAAMAGGIALGACLGAGGAGAAVLAATAAALAVSVTDATSRQPIVTDAGWTIQCALPVGLAATSMVLLTRLDQGSAIALLLLVSAYDTGDYLVGSGARNRFEGPLAGIAAIAVVTFMVSTFGIAAFGVGHSWLFGALVAMLAPLGQLFASAVLPAAAAPASGLRRLDSLLLAGPVWYLGVAAVT